MGWRFLDSGRASGALNMAVDEAIAILHGKGKSPPTIRFYGWEPACLSIGYFQSVEKEVDVDRCRRNGIDLIRRPTGGRAVLHDDELTYSLIAEESDRLVSGGVVESYRKISVGLVAGLELLSVRAEVAPQVAGARAMYHSGACFDSASTYELTVGGKKLVGSAQVRKGGVVLQHGSVLLGFDTNVLISLLKTGAVSPENLATHLNQRVTSLAAVAGRRVAFSEAADALRRGFEQALGVPLEEGTLTKEEETLAKQLLEDKYATAAWNYRK